jgi:uncharacterized protein with ParB-like and HNH nuclease domain
MSHVSTQIELKPISEILNYKFYVPSYQRGYRWTGQEVTALLNDIYEFMLENEQSNKSAFYCLQPLIVYQKEDKYYLIDGQQRLTTLHIILTYLKDIAAIMGKPKYELTFETRPDSGDYLKNIDELKANDNVDYFHIYEAYKAVEDWFKNKDGVLKMKLLTTLTASDDEGKNVKFIWYEIDPKDAIDVFTRINIGKIPLTNSELIKALFVREKNFAGNEIAKQIFIASEWDEIERRLSEPSFWYFLSDSVQNSNYDNKIEFLFDLISQKNKDSEKLHTFLFIHNLINEHRDSAKTSNITFNIDTTWKLAKDKFQTISEWHNNHQLYHYIGYLLNTGSTVSHILKLSENKSKNDFITLIKQEIKDKTSKINIDELNFERAKDKRNIKRILLLFNIETILQSQKSYIRFPFEKYKTENWDIEHINPQTPFDKLELYKDWCLDIVTYITGKKLTIEELLISSHNHNETTEELLKDLDTEDVEIIESVIDILNDEKEFRPKTEELAIKLFNRYRGEESEENNHLSNLTLLDSYTNRSYGNALFPIKRNTIINNDKNGVFIPICTKNVFLKYYSKQFTDVMHWKKTDADAYFKEIASTLSFYYN